MRTQLYFWKPLMDRHKKELSLVGDYFNRTKPQFDNIEKEAEDYVKSLYENIQGSEYIDEASFSEYATEKEVEFYETLATMRANHLFMTISMLYHIWEQQLIKFVIGELRHSLKFKKKSFDYDDVQLIFQAHGVNISSTKAWKIVRELKFLANTIKHGDGDSAEKLRKLRSEYFKIENVEADSLELSGSVLLDYLSLQVKESDLFAYVEATKSFWDEMPKVAYSDTEEIIKALNEKKRFGKS